MDRVEGVVEGGSGCRWEERKEKELGFKYLRLWLCKQSHALEACASEKNRPKRDEDRSQAVVMPAALETVAG